MKFLLGFGMEYNVFFIEDKLAVIAFQIKKRVTIFVSQSI